MQVTSSIYKEMISLGIIDAASVKEFYPVVRDRNDVGVMRCEKSGVIFLNSTDHVASSYYSEKAGTSYWSAEDRQSGLKVTFEEDSRRREQIINMVKGKVYADVGSGMGGILDLVKNDVKGIYAVEPQTDIRNNLIKLGYDVVPSIEEFSKRGVKVDFISLFHVFEHVTNPFESLKQMHGALNDGGKIFIEVPHAGDALFTKFDLDAFKKFTFWSEHLLLHTKQSLKTYLEKAGFRNVNVTGFQRYPLSNHMYWLREGKPGGQNVYTELRDPELEKAYAAALDKHDLTDTIIAIAEK